MARKSSLPENVTNFKPCKCARIRKDGDVYRVYKYSAVKLASGQWSSDYGYLIGKIIPGEGFFPSYKQLMEVGESNYTQENYDKFCDWRGVYFLQTTATDTAPAIYYDYKGRWSIETYNN